MADKKKRDNYRDEAVFKAASDLLELFGHWEWKQDGDSLKFIDRLERLWEQGATIGFHDG